MLYWNCHDQSLIRHDFAALNIVELQFTSEVLTGWPDLARPRLVTFFMI